VLTRLFHFFAAAWVGLAILMLAAHAHAATPSSAWQEVHQTLGDAHIAVAADGSATVVQRLRYRVVAGRFKSVDFAGFDPRAEFVTDTIAQANSGSAIGAKVEGYPNRPGTVRITFDDPKGLRRGSYVVDVKYRLDLVATKAIARDGAMWRLAWTSPPSSEGQSARVVFDLPPAPTEPGIAQSADETTMATLHRLPDKDRLELERAHVPHGEVVTWAVRVDPKALPLVASAHLRPPLATQAHEPAASSVEIMFVACGFAVLAGLFAMALRKKQATHTSMCADAGARPRPLLPLPLGMAPFVPFAYGGIAASALAILLWSNPTIGALLVVVAMALATHLSPRGEANEDTVLAPALPQSRVPRARDVFDIGTWTGKLAALGIVAVVAALAALLATRVAGAMVAILLVATALVPLFLTGNAKQVAFILQASESPSTG